MGNSNLICAASHLLNLESYISRSTQLVTIGCHSVVNESTVKVVAQTRRRLYDLCAHITVMYLRASASYRRRGVCSMTLTVDSLTTE